MESVYHIVTIRVNETSWAHVWRLCSHYLGMGYDNFRIREESLSTFLKNNMVDLSSTFGITFLLLQKH
jgi:hypothetical protein